MNFLHGTVQMKYGSNDDDDGNDNNGGGSGFKMSSNNKNIKCKQKSSGLITAAAPEAAAS